ncbi:MAG: hypothetical protein RJB13_1552 [Pseudomonadota bacterium]
MKLTKNPLVIFAYHGLVNETRSVLNDFCFVTPAKLHFDLSMVCKMGWSLIGLQDGLSALSNGTLERPSVAITFDDGLSSVVELGSDILSEHRIRATIFMPSEISSTGEMLWYTKVIGALSNSQRTHFDFLGRHFPITDLTERALASELIQNALRSLHPTAIELLTDDLLRRLEVDESIVSNQFRVLSPSQCADAGINGVFDFGAHSATHSIHSQLDESELKLEIGKSLQFVASLQSNRPLLYAYPNGGKRDFSERCKKILAEKGAYCALSTIPGWNFTFRDAFSLRRFCIGQHTDLSRPLSSIRWKWQRWLA